MARRTIDFGIDLGTTNSEIACFGQGRMRVFRNYLQEEYIPSVVHVDASGMLTVGRNAYDLTIRDPENTVSEFKRFMGQEHKVVFKDSKKCFTPEELSAEVLKELKAAVKDSLPEEDALRAAVITVPANFELVQCAATQRAARLAGMEHSPLLQEPIAASVAYGFLEKLPKGYWMVYDLGGGTFDVALMSVRDGQLMVVDHSGDNNLGGKDIDWSIVERIIYPALQSQYNLPDLTRGNQRYRDLEAHAKHFAEQAKIALSRRESVAIPLHPERSRDADGREITLSIPFSRAELEQILEPYVERTLPLCQEVLKRQQLSGQGIESIILVGGPTWTPYIRERLKAEFNVRLESRVDPLTVVAQGAAVFAASQMIPEEFVQRPKDRVYIRLEYKPLIGQVKASVGGKLEWPDGNGASDGVTVQIRREDGEWQSGRIEVKDGTFFTQVALREGCANTFAIAIADGLGNNIACNPESFTITHGLTIGDPPLTRSVGVELSDGSFRIHLERGVTLPKSKLIKYKTAKPLTPGSQEALKIKLYEGEFPIASRNHLIDVLEISGGAIDRQLPEGSDIDVTIRIDQSRVPTIEVFIPHFDKVHKQATKIKVSAAPDPIVLEQEFRKEQERVEQLRAICDQQGDSALEVAIKAAHDGQIVEELEREIGAAKGGDPGAAHKAEARLKELKAALDSVEKLAEWPLALKEWMEALDGTKPLVNALGAAEEQEQLQAYEHDAEAAISTRSAKRLKKVAEKVLGLYWRIQFRRDEFWLSAFQGLATGKHVYQDQNRAQELIQEGGRALERNDLEALKSVTQELWTLIDRDEQWKLGEKIDSDAGIR